MRRFLLWVIALVVFGLYLYVTRGNLVYIFNWSDSELVGRNMATIVITGLVVYFTYKKILKKGSNGERV